MSNTDASIDPLLRSIAPPISNFRPNTPLASTDADSFPRALEYEQASSYQPHQHLDNARGINTNINTPHQESNFNDPKRSRACEACRGLKVRCEPNHLNPDAPCKRCAKANRLCIVTAPSRKRRKKTDSRVAELEKKIDALTASLAAQRAGSIPEPQGTVNEYVPDSPHAISHFRTNPFQPIPGDNYGSPFANRPENNNSDWAGYSKPEIDPKANVPSKTIAGQKRKHSVTFPTQSDIPLSIPSPSTKRIGISEGWAGYLIMTTPPNDYTDVIDRGLITVEIASQIFENFIENMAPLMPIVAFPPGTTSTNVRKSTPILFLAILSASSGMNFPHLQQSLTNEVMSIYAERIIIKGEKSLELIQAIQISTLWYWLPDYFEELKFYQLTHTASVMAIDMGMGQKVKSPKSRHSSVLKDHFRLRYIPPDPESIEARRAWLGCYWLCCNAAMTLRRPNLIRWSSFIADSIDVLKKSPEALASDRLLCEWVSLQHIAEEIGVQFSMHDPFSLVSIADKKVQRSLKIFERDLEKWKMDLEPESITPLLSMTENYVNLYMHEIAIHVDHNIEDFKPPFTEESLRSLAEDNYQTPLSIARVNALSVCLTSIDGIFDTFLSLGVEKTRSLHVGNFVRVAYAVVVLMKIYFASAIPNCELGKVIETENMKVEQYLEKLIDVLRAASAEEKSRSAAKFLSVLSRLKSWFQHHRERTQSCHATSQDTTNNSSKEGCYEDPKERCNLEIPVSNKKQSDYSPANTPLQLLSEVATGNSRSQCVRSCSTPSNEWHNSSQFSNPGFSSGPLPVSQVYNPATMNGNIDPSLGLDLDYATSDGLEHMLNLSSGVGEFGPFLGDDTFFSGSLNSVVQSGMGFDGL